MDFSIFFCSYTFCLVSTIFFTRNAIVPPVIANPFISGTAPNPPKGTATIPNAIQPIPWTNCEAIIILFFLLISFVFSTPSY